MMQLLNRSLATIIKGGVKNDENVNITKRKNKKKKKKNKSKKKKQHNNHDTEAPAPTEPALYRYPNMVKTVGNFKLHSSGGEFTQSQIIVIQGVKDTGKTTLLRLLVGTVAIYSFILFLINGIGFIYSFILHRVVS